MRYRAALSQRVWRQASSMTRTTPAGGVELGSTYSLDRPEMVFFLYSPVPSKVNYSSSHKCGLFDMSARTVTAKGWGYS